MSAVNLNLFLSLETTINNAQVFAGQRNVPTAQVIAGAKYDVSDTIANASGDDFNLVTLWDVNDGGLEAFDVLWFESDFPVLLELRNDGSEITVIPVTAGVPFVYGGGDELDNTELVDGSATTFTSVINRIRAKNNTTGASTANAANVRLLLFD